MTPENDGADRHLCSQTCSANLTDDRDDGAIILQRGMCVQHLLHVWAIQLCRSHGSDEIKGLMNC